MFASIDTLAHGIRHEAFKNGQRLKKISNTDSAERAAFFNKKLPRCRNGNIVNQRESLKKELNKFVPERDYIYAVPKRCT